MSIDKSLLLKARFVGKRVNGCYAWEIGGVIIDAYDARTAMNKYLRRKK